MRVSRRGFLKRSAGLVPAVLSPSLFLGGGVPRPAYAADATEGRRLFTLGVASGDPWPDSVVLWTRLAPDPLNGGGMGREAVEVAWDIAVDDRMSRIVRAGTALARPEFGHSVHVEADGLEPGRWYWYRFRTPREESRIGRTRTMPAPGSMPPRLRFATASCQSWESGFYTAYQHMAAEDLDLVFFLGDYIYEGASDGGGARPLNKGGTETVEEYRNRYACYRTDVHLQACHANFPWVVTPDDHEVANDYATFDGGSDWTRERFIKLRAAAYRAYYEHMPLRRASIPSGPDMLLYRQISFGRLAAFDVLDTRQYRDSQPCGGWRSEACADSLDPAKTITGAAQEAWLFDCLRDAPATWNVVAQQVPMMQRLIPTEDKRLVLAMDKWDGYIGSRNRLFDALARSKTSNPIVLSGDIHSGWIGDLKADFYRESSPTLGTEFVCSSIASGGDGRAETSLTPELLANNPHLRFNANRRGYLRTEITPDLWCSDFRLVDYIGQPGAPVRTAGSCVIESGRPGALMV